MTAAEDAAMSSRGTSNRLDVWAFADAHVGADLRHGRTSLADAIRQTEEGFHWDLAVDCGDMSGAQGVPDDDEGREVVRQFGSLVRHRREDVYSLSGNHDRSPVTERPGNWWRTWVDPMGEHPDTSRVDSSLRRHPVDGTWERYSFRVGNVLFLMMSDINSPTQALGRDVVHGNPGGAVSGDTFEWWVRMVEANQDKIIVSAHHYVLRETTVASGDWEGFRKDAAGQWRSHYHGYKPQADPIGASHLHWVDGKPAVRSFERYLADHPGAVDVWLGAHTHTHPDDTYGGRSHVETKWGVHFVNVAALTLHHNTPENHATPMSRLLSFDGDALDVRCWLHTDHHAPRGWYEPVRRSLRLAKAYRG